MSFRALLIGFLAAALVAGGFAAWYVANRGGNSITASVTSSGSALIGGPFELTDQKGAVRNEQDFQGGYMLVVFGYTFCPDVCPFDVARNACPKRSIFWKKAIATKPKPLRRSS